MKLIALILTTLIPLSLATDELENVCGIRFDKHDRAAMYSRNFLAGKSNRWPNGIVPYKISDEFTETDIKGIKKAMSLLEDNSCIKFVEYTDQKNHISIYTGETGCFASLGYNSRRKVGIVHLQRNSYCMRIGTIAHELLHALGFAHEHTRPDRDQYLTINWSNLSPSIVRNWFRSASKDESPLPPVCNPKDPKKDFDKCYVGFKTTTLGLRYDFQSVMHYGLRAGSLDGTLVMTPKRSIPPGIRIGQRKGPSYMDYKKLNRAYSCNGEVTTAKPTTTKKPCRDYYGNCNSYKHWCRVKYVRKGCQKTCGACGGPEPERPGCVDDFASCGNLKSACKSSAFIQNSCKYTCNKC